MLSQPGLPWGAWQASCLAAHADLFESVYLGAVLAGCGPQV